MTEAATPLLTLSRFEPALHLKSAVDALLSVRDHGGVYPPVKDVARAPDAFAGWFMEGEALERWVVLVDGAVAGHIMLTEAHPYLINALDGAGYPVAPGGMYEIARFFVDPRHQEHGLGKLLFNAAVAAARSAGRQPALAVVDTSTAARRFYARNGMMEVCTFFGFHGVNHVFVG